MKSAEELPAEDVVLQTRKKPGGIDQANKSAGWMPMALIAEEGRGKLR